MTQRPEPYARLVSDDTFNALERLETYAHDRERTLPGLALAWLLADDRVAQVVVGPGRPEHLAPVAEALAKPLTEDERIEVDALC
jgi:aryl-alcohol dehydrogenase-like predicted oxidoreductase